MAMLDLLQCNMTDVSSAHIQGMPTAHANIKHMHASHQAALNQDGNVLKRSDREEAWLETIDLGFRI